MIEFNYDFYITEAFNIPQTAANWGFYGGDLNVFDLLMSHP